MRVPLVVVVIGLAALAGAGEARAEEGLRFVGSDAVSMEPGADVTLTVAGVSTDPAAGPLRVFVVSADGKEDAVALKVSCKGAAPHSFDADDGPPLECPASPLLTLELTSTKASGKAAVVVSQKTSSATRVVSVAPAAAAVTTPPKKLDLRLESWTTAASGETIKPRQEFAVSGAPMSVIATGSAGEAKVTLQHDTDGPAFVVTDVDDYGDLAASFDINGTAEGGTLDITIHHRRHWFVVVIVLVVGSLTAFFLSLARLGAEKAAAKARFLEAEADAKREHDDLVSLAALTKDLEADLVRQSWDPATVLDLPSSKDQGKADKVQAYVDRVEAYGACVAAARHILGAAAVLADAVPLAATARGRVLQGPGSDVVKAEPELEAAGRFLSEAQRVRRRLAEAIADGPTNAARLKQLQDAKQKVESATDLTKREPLDAGWAALSEGPPDALVFEMENRAMAVRAVAFGPRQAVIDEAQAPPRSRASRTALLLASWAAAFAATVLGFVIALAIDAGSILGENSGWGTVPDMIAAFGTSFTVTGSLQVARRIGAVVGGA